MPATGTTRKRPLPDWDRLTFSYSETDAIYRALGDADRDPIWDEGEILPSGPLALSPAAAFFSYGIGVFEGLKARRAEDGRILMFRHADNGRRLQRSAERLVMPPFPVERFVDAVEEVVRRNARFVPPHGKGSFYIRPVQHGIEAQLGIRPSRQFWVVVFGCPVGSYFAGGSDAAPARGLRLRVLEQGRVAPGGTGAAKAIGNYAGGLAVALPWKQQGFDDVLYLDARGTRHVTETSGSNVFVKLRGGPLVTPPLDDQILPGITRDSAIRIARDVLGVEVVERPIGVDEVLADAEELFCTGTAYTVWNADEIVLGDRVHRFAGHELQLAILRELGAIQRGTGEDRFGWISEVAL